MGLFSGNVWAVLIVVWRDTQCTENERIDEKQSLD